MKIYKVFVLFILISLSACSRKEKAVIVGNLQNADGTTCTLEELRITSVRTIDSVNIKRNGNFRYMVSLKEPGYYQLNFEGGKTLTLILSPDERMKFTADLNDFYKSKSIVGSVNTERVNVLHDSLRNTIQTLQAISKRYEVLQNEDGSDKTEMDSLANLYNKIQLDYHKYTIRFILEDFSSLANIAALYQEYSPGEYVFTTQYDMQFFKLVSDTLSKYYPKVRQVKVLNNNYNAMISVYQKQKLLQMANVKETGLPDLLLPDQRGKMISLSSLNGKTVLLNFWSVNQLESVKYVVELKKIYEKYHKMGFEIYQVSIDKTIPRWKKALEFEELAWINVIDTAFPVSSTYTLFNVKELPMNYLINAEQSDIIGKNISPAALDRTLSNLFNK